MIELYHNDMSVCAQKVRFALAEKWFNVSYLPLMQEKSLEAQARVKAIVAG